MSWHDNHVHALRITEGDFGAGELILDIDYILEWLSTPDGGCQFRIAPSWLCFTQVTRLKLHLDYATPGAALGPFSIHAIERSIEKRESYEARLWRLKLSWPAGDITFEAEGFQQTAYGVPVISDGQWLDPEERRVDA